MSGSGQLWVQPSVINFGALIAGQWRRGIPTPGVPANIPAVQGISDCKNLLSMSPPTLLEEFQIVSYSLAYGAVLTNGGDFASPFPNITTEIALLVNDRLAYAEEITQGATGGAATVNWVTGSMAGDLVNPIRLGARDRLSIRLGIKSDTAASVGSNVQIGAQLDPVIGSIGVESTLSYNVIDLPASRRL